MKLEVFFLLVLVETQIKYNNLSTGENFVGFNLKFYCKCVNSTIYQISEEKYLRLNDLFIRLNNDEYALNVDVLCVNNWQTPLSLSHISFFSFSFVG